MSRGIRSLVKVNIINEECRLCGCVRKLTDHHLTPQSIRGTNNFRTMRVCKKCHSWVHKQFHNDTLAKKYNTEDKLMEYVKLHGFPEPPKRTPEWRKNLKNRLKMEDYELRGVIKKMVRI